MVSLAKIKPTPRVKTFSIKNTGPPARYLLVTNKQSLDKDDQLRKSTFGEREPTKVNKTILIVGETGTGKSTLINAMVNYILGVEKKNEICFEIVEEEIRSQTESQTTAVTVYEVFGYEGLRSSFPLTIIDTPGYGDTRGIQEDKLISEKLYQLFRSSDGIHQIDIVGLVVKATENRLNMEKNIVALITHSDGGEPTAALKALEVAKVPGARDKKNRPVYFLFNNRQHNACCETEKQAKKEASAMRHAQNISKDGMKEFTEFLGGIISQNVKMTEGVLRERKQLEACIINLQGRIEMIELKQNEIQQTQRALQEHKEEVKNNKNFTYYVNVPCKEKVKLETGWATTCPTCKENCHYPDCWWITSLSWCSAMKNNKCTVCTKKCSFSTHEKKQEIYVNKTKKEERTHDDLKKKHEINEKGMGEKGNLISILEEELEKAKDEKVNLVEKSYQCVMSLEEIALKADAFSTHVHLDFLIEKMKETGNTENTVLFFKSFDHSTYFHLAPTCTFYIYIC
uniref:Septin-type G domain-containing protein n=1 Tax=Oncorhynchus mykiss TaxID=8022 RepID=A0A8L0DUQ0_ONCMY